jgi:hypothetical protein
VTTVVEKLVEALPCEVATCETSLTSNKVEEQPTYTPAAIVESTELPTKDVTPLTPHTTEDKIIETVVTDVTPIIEAKPVQEKPAEITQPSLATPVQEQPVHATEAEVAPVLIAQSEEPIPEAAKEEAPTQAKLTDTQVTEEKPA